METPDYSFYTSQGWSVDVWKSQHDNLVYASILNQTKDTIWEFRINSDGHLQMNKGYGFGLQRDWVTVARTFTDNGK